jgi:CheY-like chemotaxis protein
VAQTILLVDDEFSSLEVLALLLAQEGYDVVTASDGEEALERLREKHVDLVITDFWMPRTTGLALMEQMQADEGWRSIPVLLMTAAYESDSVRHPALAGVIPKPLRFEALLAAVRRLLGEGENR